MTSRLQGGRGTTGEEGKNATGFDVLNRRGRRQKALQFQRVNYLGDRNLPGRHVRGVAHVATADGLLEMRVGGGYRCGGYAQHRGDGENYRYRPNGAWPT